jgi:hypothetical protein
MSQKVQYFSSYFLIGLMLLAALSSLQPCVGQVGMQLCYDFQYFFGLLGTVQQ